MRRDRRQNLRDVAQQLDRDVAVVQTPGQRHGCRSRPCRPVVAREIRDRNERLPDVGLTIAEIRRQVGPCVPQVLQRLALTGGLVPIDIRRAAFSGTCQRMDSEAVN